MKAPIYNQEGKETGKIDLPEKVFGLKPNSALVYQAIVTEEANKRIPVAHTKGRGEVRGGGKKPWKQKGTGRARHGSIRSPIWVGGGVAHGPTKDKVYSKKLNRKMRNIAMATILSAKARDGELILLDSFGATLPKTKEAVVVLAMLSKSAEAKTLMYKKGRRALMVIPTPSSPLEKSFRNISSVNVVLARNLSALPTMTYKYLVFVDPAKCFEVLLARMTN
nr:ribosomal protein L4 [uncultured bacterium]